MNEITIRPARAADAAPIIDIHRRSIQVLCRAEYSEKQLLAWIGKRTPEQLAQRIAWRTFLIAEMAGRPVGYAAYHTGSGELLSVFVDPDYARQGIATALVQEIFADASRQGLRHMWLDSSLTAIPFYEKMGFKGVLETSHAFGDVPLECLRMEITLTD